MARAHHFIQEHERQEAGGQIQLYLIPKHKRPGITSQLGLVEATFNNKLGFGSASYL